MFTPDNQMSEQSEENSGARKLEQCGAPLRQLHSTLRIFSFQHKTQGNAGTKAVRNQEGAVSPRANLKRTLYPKKAVYGFPGA